MTAVSILVDLRRAARDGVNVPLDGSTRWQPTLRRSVDEHVVLPASFIGPATGTVAVAVTGLDWVWRVDELVPGGCTRYVQVTAGDRLYSELVDVDPATLVPAESAVPAWDAAVEQIRVLMSEAGAAADAAFWHANAAANDATQASQAAWEATQEAWAAATARTDAETARTDAETARTGAETARTGAETALAATLAAVVITGLGRPDVAATMTPAVQALVAAATSGASFSSLDGPQGAWAWRKRGSTWVCVEGDTGPIDFSSKLLNGWTKSAGSGQVTLQRIGPLLSFRLLINGSANTSDKVLSFSGGWAPSGDTDLLYRAGSSFATGYVTPSGAWVPGTKETRVWNLQTFINAASAWPTSLTP